MTDWKREWHVGIKRDFYNKSWNGCQRIQPLESVLFLVAEMHIFHNIKLLFVFLTASFEKIFILTFF
jgi:hypothetical protein